MWALALHRANFTPMMGRCIMSEVREPLENTRRPRRRPPSLFWPLVLIGTGVILLLSNLGYLPW